MSIMMKKVSEWIESFRFWWSYNMDPCNACGLLYSIIDFWGKKVKKWLTPWLWNARSFLSFCINENGTKLLNFDANYFYIRTRDDKQFYFTGTVSPFGMVRVWRTRWLNDKGESVNLFMHGICTALCEEPEAKEERLTEVKEMIYRKRILTQKQLAVAMQEILNFLEFDWDWYGAKCELFEEKLKLPEKDRKKFEDALEQAVLKCHFPESSVKNWWELESKDIDRYLTIFKDMTLEDAKQVYIKKSSVIF